MAERLTSFNQIQAPIEVAFFDLGGVVFNFLGLEDLAGKFDRPLLEVKAYWLSRDNDICRGILSPQQFYRDLVSHFNAGDPNMDFLQFWTSRFVANKETHQAMRDIQSRGISLAVLSNIYPGVFKVAVDMGVIPDLNYITVVQSCELGIVKPDPRIFDKALRMAGTIPKKAILIDDRTENTNMVETLGWYSLPFPPSKK